ncbi:MAG: M23 family metallopeptidase [Aquificaceae bacterium]
MKNYISIIVAYHEGKKPKTIRVKKSHLKLALLSILGIILISLGSYLLNLSLLSERKNLKAKEERLKAEKLETLREKERLRLEMEKLEEEKGSLREKIAYVENKMSAVEEYLAKRGVWKRSTALGGASYQIGTGELSYLEFLKERSEHLYSTLRAVPMGYPVYGRITSHVGWRKNPFGRGYEFHTGIDIEAPYGSKVVATADGIVESTGYYGDYGKAVVISHPSGYKTLYGHLSEISVNAGQSIRAGEMIGKVGSTGRSTGPHLHYEVLYGGKHKNPIDYLVWR